MAVYFAARDPRTPIFAKLLALFVAAYALSPIDLIPDFIPILGYLDDLIIVPIGLMIVIRMLPNEILASARLRASEFIERPRSYGAAVAIVTLWLVLLALFAAWRLKR